MKKKLPINLLFIILISIIIYKNSGISLENETTYTVCGGVSVPTGILKVTSIGVKLMQIFVPIGMIIFGSVDFIKTIVSSKNDELQRSKKIFLKRMVIGCMSFLVFTIVKAVAGITENKEEYTSCLACAIKGSSCGDEVKAPFEYDYPKQISIYDTTVGFSQPPIREGAYEKKNSSNSSDNEDSPTGSGSASELIEYAKKYLGLVYVFGGNSLKKGVDCSGFTSEIFKHFGIQLAGTAHEQSKNGTKINSIDEAKPGDLLFFDWKNDGHIDHVSIYIGNGEKIHASGDKSCRGKTGNGCQVKIDTNSVNHPTIIRRMNLK